MVGDQAVTGGVCLVESVFGKWLHELEYLLYRPSIYTPGCGTLVKVLAHTLQHIFPLLSDRPAERVRLRSAEACKRDGGGHDVFLEDEDPLGSLQHGFKERVRIGDRLLPVLAANVGGDARHRPRTIKRHHRRNVKDARRAQLLDIAAHP